MPRRFDFLFLLPVCVSLLLAGCGAGVQTGQRSAGWLELGTPHFVIETDLREAPARRIAQSLEDARAALLACAWSGATDPRGRTRVLVFARPKDLDRYTGLDTRGVAITRAGFERLLAFSPGSEGGLPRVAVHELAHDLSQWFLPLQPPWLAEGLAVYLEGIELDRARGRAVMGATSARSAKWLRQTGVLPSSSTLFATREAHARDPRDTASFYAGSWYFVHYLLNEQSEGFGQFQKRLMRLVPWERAWSESFPMLTPADIDAGMVAYARKGQYLTLKASVTLPVFRPSLRALSPAEVHGAHALLASTLGQVIGDREMKAALELDPNELDALTVHFHALPSAAADRPGIAERAVKAHPDAGEAWLLAALAASSPDERRNALDRAVRLAPDHPGVAWLLAEDELERKNPHAALEHSRLALRRSGVHPKMLAVHVSALAAAGDCEEAAALLESSTLLFNPECKATLRDEAQDVTCAAYVQRAFERTPSSCGAPPG